MTEDPKISQRYRELSREEPAREIDEAILAAARREAETRPAPLVVPSGRRRWYFPLAAAAIIVLAVAVTVQVERQQPDPELAVPPVTGPKAPAEEQREPVKPAAKAEPARKAAPMFTPDPKPDALPAEPQAAPAPTPASASPPVPQQPGVASGVQESRQADAAAAERARSEVQSAKESQQAEAAAAAERARSEAQRAPASASRPMARLAAEPPERWLERIAELRKQGKHEEADKALAEFRRTYPDYRISEAMLEKVEKK